MTSASWSPQGQTRRLGQSDSPRPMPRIEQPIRLIGDGPCVASTSHAIETQPFCWDTNGFYRRLGLPPGAPRIEVARAFMEMDGHRSSMLTNAARVLIDKRTKKLYDATPLGSLWPDDESLAEAVISGDFEVVQQDTSWAYYVDGVTPTDDDREHLATFRWMVAYLLFRSSSPANRFALGVCSGEPYVGRVGFRLVAFVPFDSKPSWEYASSIAMALQRAVMVETR